MKSLTNINPRQKRKNSLTLWLGISTDEQRRAKPSSNKWYSKQFPLLNVNLSRRDCEIYNYYILNRSVPKSSCYFCPFIHRQEWMLQRWSKLPFVEQDTRSKWVVWLVYNIVTWGGAVRGILIFFHWSSRG